MDDVEITLLRHVAGDYDALLGQLCMRCGMVLDEGQRFGCAVRDGGPDTGPPRGWPAGAAVMASAPGGSFRVLESALRADRDRSDEADCPSIVEVATAAKPLCWCGHRVDQHAFCDVPGGAGCVCCSCVEYSPGED